MADVPPLADHVGPEAPVHIYCLREDRTQRIEFPNETGPPNERLGGTAGRSSVSPGPILPEFPFEDLDALRSGQ